MSRKIAAPVSSLLVIAVTAILSGCDRPADGDAKIDVIDDSGAVANSKTSTLREIAWPPLTDDDANASTALVSATSAVATNNYYIVLDGSGSMLSRECGGGSSKIDAALSAIRGFVASIPADTNVGLAAFDRRAISERVPLGLSNRDALYAALKEVRAGSDTPLRSSIQIGYDKLTAQARTQLGYGEYHLVIVTDGNPDPASEDPTPVVNKILSDSPVIVHTIGFCIDNDHVLNQRDRTYYASATNPAELQQGLQAVLAESTTFDADSFSK